MTRVTWMSRGQDDLVWDDLENEIILWNYFFSYHFCSQPYKNNQKALMSVCIYGDSSVTIVWVTLGPPFQKRKRKKKACDSKCEKVKVKLYFWFHDVFRYRLKSHKRSYHPRPSLSCSLVGLQCTPTLELSKR